MCGVPEAIMVGMAIAGSAQSASSAHQQRKAQRTAQEEQQVRAAKQEELIKQKGPDATTITAESGLAASQRMKQQRAGLASTIKTSNTGLSLKPSTSMPSAFSSGGKTLLGQ